jgi:hypothetical protein
VCPCVGGWARVRNLRQFLIHHLRITTHVFLAFSFFSLLSSSSGVRTHGSLLQWTRTYLTAAGFDWDTFNATTVYDRSPPPASAPVSDRVRWLLALGGKVGGELGVFSMGATYGEESEGSSYIPGMMNHVAGSGLAQQAFSFGDYLSGEMYWSGGSNANLDQPRPAVIWLHPYSYNTGYAPAYMQAYMHKVIAQAGFVTMAFDQVEPPPAHMHAHTGRSLQKRPSCVTTTTRVCREDTHRVGFHCLHSLLDPLFGGGSGRVWFA